MLKQPGTANDLYIRLYYSSFTKTRSDIKKVMSLSFFF